MPVKETTVEIKLKNLKNNLEYLKCFLDSIYNNSSFEHEIILHINDGSDGTTQYAKENKIKYLDQPYTKFKDKPEE